MKPILRVTGGVVSLAMAVMIVAPIAFADTAPQQKKKNDWRTGAIAAGAATLYGAARGDKTLTTVGALGTAYAAKRYEDERRAQARAAAQRQRYYRTGAATTNGYQASQQAAFNNTSGPVQVHVNGQPIAFTGIQPFETQGTVLVPLRGVFEAMGASVDYNAGTRTIYAQKADRMVTLPLRSTVATVNGRSQPLSMPADVIHGTTMVPLRFVAEALGSNVQWVGSQRLVQIETTGAPVAFIPPAGQNSFTGIAQRVAATADPREIIVRVNGEERAVPISDDAAIMRRLAGREAAAVALSNIMPGDTVVVQQDENGLATRITATYGVRQGRVSSVGALADGNTLIVLENGTMVELAPGATVRRDGATVASSQIEPYDHVTIRTSPADNLGYSVTLRKELRAHRRQ